MRCGWLSWLLVLLIGFQALMTRTTASEKDADASITAVQDLQDILTPYVEGVNTALQVIIDIGKIGLGVVQFIDTIVDQISNLNFDVKLGSNTPLADWKMLAMFEVLSDRLDQVEHGITGIVQSLQDLANGMHNMVRWEIALNTMQEYVRPINTLYKRFRLYQKIKDKIERHTLKDFADDVVSHDAHSVMSLMAHLHSMAAPETSQRTSFLGDTVSVSAFNEPRFFHHVNESVTQNTMLKRKLTIENMDVNDGPQRLSLQPSLFRMLQDALQTGDNCHLTQSPQQLIEGLHIILSLTEARGFAMLEFAWMILRVHNEGKFTAEQEVSKALYLKYSEDIMREAKRALEAASREFFRCDPQHHQEGRTYSQLTELLQGYIENEVDMNAGGSCKKNCGYYQHARSKGCYMPKTQYCGKHRRCYGTIHDCQYYMSRATVCLSKKPYRRYDFIRYSNKKHLGRHQNCEGTEMKVNSWQRFLYHCSYCLCLCDDASSPSSDRYVSLVPAVTDLHNNMVVTGVKLIKRRRVIHVQIQQGQALPQGQISSSTIHWVDPNPIEVHNGAYLDGTHYKKLSFEERSIDLDRLEGPPDHVVTGVKFRMLGSHLNLEARITPINYKTGVLQAHKSYWINNENTPAMAKNPRTELKLHSPDDPTKFPQQSRIDSQPHTFMRFVPTDRVKDAAQLTVPFFDSQSVAPTPSCWLSGIELFHKGQPGSGGFLGMKIMTYDMTSHME